MKSSISLKVASMPSITVRNIIVKVCALILCAAGLLPWGECNAQWTRVGEDTIRLDGEIDRDSWQSYQQVAEGGYSKVVLKSLGGSPMPALLIARDMHKHQPRIVVEDYCLSACANYLLMASPAPKVGCGSLVIWHGTPTAGYRDEVEAMRLEGRNPKLVEVYRQWYEGFDAMEAQFFRDAGVDRSILFDSGTIVQRAGILPESTFDFDEMTGDYTETTSAALWIPITAVMRSYGLDTRNFCPSYDADIPATVERLGIKTPYTSSGMD